MKYYMLVFVGLLIPLACSDDPAGIDCGVGENVVVDGEDFCVFRQSVVIENGFECPPTVPFLTQGDGVGICGERGELPLELIEVIAERYEPVNNSTNNSNSTNNATNSNSSNSTNNATNSNTSNSNNSNNSTNNGFVCASNAECAAGQICVNGSCVVE